MNSNFWGSGGMFEQALANKMALQDSQRLENLSTAGLRDSMVGVDRQRADTDRLRADREYDLGLRKDTISKGLLDVQRGELGVKNFAADTDRLIGFNRFGKAAPDSDFNRSLNLSTVRPYGQSSNSPAMSMLRSGSSFGDGTSSSGMSGDGASILDNVRPMGLRNGGVALKPKMVKQPGYMNGGKVKLPKGYKKGGKIGDVEKDDGTDKVEVMAREGEYFLNPETVATAFGGGDYGAGVRNLNQIVRGATGKEPGPTPVGKSGKQGFNRGGFIDDFGNLIDMANGPDAAFAARLDPRNEPTYYRQAYDVPAGSGSTSGSTGSTAGGAGSTSGPAKPANPYVEMGNKNVGESLRAGAAKAVEIGKKVLPSVETTAKGLRIVGKGAAPVGAVMDAADVVDVATDPNMGWNELGTEVGSKAGKWGAAGAGALAGGAAGAALGGPLAPVTGTLGAIAGGLGGYFGGDALIKGGRQAANSIFGLDADTRDPSERSNGIVSKAFKAQPTAAAETPTDKPPPPDADKPSATKEPDKPSLRDMMLARYQQLNDGLKGADAMKTITSLNQMEGLQRDLTELAKNDDSIRATNAKSMQAAAAKHVEDTEKYLGERLKSPKTDKDGNITGYFEDPTKLAAFKDYIANLTEKDGKTPFNFMMRDRTTQDRVLEDFSRKYEMTKRFNDRYGSESNGQPVSAMPRVGEQGLRYAIDPGTNKIREMGFGDVFNEGVSLGDWLTSFGPNKIEKRLVFDPVTQKMVAARHVVGTDADIDAQLIGTGQQFGSGLRKQPK